MSDEIDELSKALEVRHVGSLVVEDLAPVLKQVTFNMNNLKPWPNIYEGYELIDLHGRMKVGKMNHHRMRVIFGMFHALANCHIIRDVQNSGERIYVDSRRYIDEQY